MTGRILRRSRAREKPEFSVVLGLLLWASRKTQPNHSGRILRTHTRAVSVISGGGKRLLTKPRLGLVVSCWIDRVVPALLVLLTATVVHAGDPVIFAAGDIACWEPGGCNAARTAKMMAEQLNDDVKAILALGDLQYDHGMLCEFENGFDVTWGQSALAPLIRPVPEIMSTIRKAPPAISTTSLDPSTRTSLLADWIATGVTTASTSELGTSSPLTRATVMAQEVARHAMQHRRN